MAANTELSFGQAVRVIVIGRLSYLFLGTYRWQGPGAATAASLICRDLFDRNVDHTTFWFNSGNRHGYDLCIAVDPALVFFRKTRRWIE